MTERARRLRPGDTVALVAPAGPVPAELLAAGLAVLRDWGLRVREFPGLRARHPEFGYLAGDDEQRAAEFTAAWCDPGVAGVLAARGGYGCARMLDRVDWAAVRAAGPKAFAGSSDVTALHQALAVHIGHPTLFSPMPATRHFDPPAAEHLRQQLFAPDTVGAITGPATETLVPGCAEGILVGGNLSLLAAGVGTAGHRTARDGIAVLEDVTEDVYRLDGMLTHLLRSGWFDGVRAVVLGSWTECGDPAAVRALLLDRLGSLGVPVLGELGFGHVRSAPTVPLGVRAELDADARVLRLPEPALR